MPATSLAQLVAPPTKAAILQNILGRLQAAGFPTTDWLDVGPEKTLLNVVAGALLDYAASFAPAVASGAFVDAAAGAWLDLVASWYGLARNAAVSTVGTVVLSCASGAGPYALAAGQIWCLAASGLRYVSTSGGTLRPPGFSAVTHTGTGTGTVTTSGTGGNATGLSVVVKISTAGTLGTGAFQWSANGGASYGTAITIPGGGSYTDPASGITIVFAGTFVLGDTYAFSSYGQISLTVQAESPNNSAAGLNYVDGNGTITQLVTPLPGVTVANPGPAFSPVVLTGSSSGTVTPSATNPAQAVIAETVAVRIDVGGQVGAASWSYAVNGGAYTSAGAVASANLPGNITATLANALVGTSSFVAGDVFAFAAPGSWISQQGTDAESDPALRLRCKSRWPLLSVAPTLSAYQGLALAASSQVTQALVVTDTVINGQVDVFVAGQGGPLPASVVNAVIAYLKARVPQTDTPVVQSVTATAVTLAGTITYRASAGLATVQTAVQAAVQQYIAGVGIGGTANAGVVRLAGVEGAIMSVPGVVDLTGLTINGSGANLTLTAPASGGPPTPPAAATVGAVAGMFTWTAI